MSAVAGNPLDLRVWLDEARRLGELKEVRGAHWNLELGAISEVNVRKALPPALLNKTTPLSADEWRQIRTHPDLGCALARRLGYDERIRTLIRHHHEHWDGSGYPDGLQQTDTPAGARVIAVADVFDALTSPRPYRIALDAGAALAVMRAEMGTVLDPHFFSVFEETIENGLRRIDRRAGKKARLLSHAAVH